MMSEWLGTNILILAITPLGYYSRAQSDTSKGMTRKLLPEFDPDGWSKFQDIAIKYGKA